MHIVNNGDQKSDKNSQGKIREIFITISVYALLLEMSRAQPRPKNRLNFYKSSGLGLK